MDLNNPRETITNYFFDNVKTPFDYGQFYGYEHGFDE